MAAVDWSDDVQVAEPAAAPTPATVDWSDSPQPQAESAPPSTPQRNERAAAFGYSDGGQSVQTDAPTVVDWSDSGTQVSAPSSDQSYTFQAFEDPQVFEQSQQGGESENAVFVMQPPDTRGIGGWIEDRARDVGAAADRLGSRVDTARREFEQGDYGQAALQGLGAVGGVAADVVGGGLNALSQTGELTRRPLTALQEIRNPGVPYFDDPTLNKGPLGAVGQLPMEAGFRLGQQAVTQGPQAALDTIGNAFNQRRNMSSNPLGEMAATVAIDPLLPLAPGMLNKVGTAGKVADAAVFSPWYTAQKLGGPLGGSIFGISLVTSGAMQTVNPESAGLAGNLPVVGPIYKQLRDSLPAENRGAFDFGSNLLIGIAAGLALTKAPIGRTPVLATAARAAQNGKAPVQEGDLVKTGRTLAAPTKATVVNTGGRYLENLTDTLWQASDGNPARFNDAVSNLVSSFRQGADGATLAKVAAENGINLPAETFAAPQNRTALGLIARSVEAYLGGRLDDAVAPGMVLGSRGQPAQGRAVPIADPVNRTRAFLDTLYKVNGEDPRTNAQILASRAVEQLRADIGRTTPEWQSPVARYFAALRQLRDLPADDPANQPATQLVTRMRNGLGEYLVPGTKAHSDVLAVLADDASPAQRAQVVNKLHQVMTDAERVSRQLGFNKADGPSVPALDPKMRKANDNLMMRLATDSKILISPLWLTSRPQYWVNNAVTNAIISAWATQGRVFGALGQRGEDAYNLRRGTGASQNLPRWVDQGIRADLAGEGSDTLFVGMARRAAERNATLGAPGRAVKGLGTAIGDAPGISKVRQFFTESYWRKATYIAEHNRIFDEQVRALASTRAASLGLQGDEAIAFTRAMQHAALSGSVPDPVAWYAATDPMTLPPMERDIIVRIAQETTDPDSFRAAVRAFYEQAAETSRAAVAGRPVSPEQGLVPVRPNTPPSNQPPVSAPPVAPGSAADFRRTFGIEDTPPAPPPIPQRRETGTYRPATEPGVLLPDEVAGPRPGEPIPLKTIRDLVADSRGALYTVPADAGAAPYRVVQTQLQQAMTEAATAKQAAIDHLRSGNRGPAWSNERARLESAAKAAEQKVRTLQDTLRAMPEPRQYTDFELQSGAVVDPIARELTVKVKGQEVQVGLTDAVAREYDRIAKAYPAATAKKMQMELLGLDQTIKPGAFVTDGSGRVGYVERKNIRGKWLTEIIPVDRNVDAPAMGDFRSARLIPGEGVTILGDSPNFIRSRTDLNIDDLGVLPQGPRNTTPPNPELQPRPLASGDPARPIDLQAIRADLRALGDVRVQNVDGAMVYDTGNLAKMIGPYASFGGPLNRIQGIPSSAGLDTAALTKIRRSVAAMASEASEFNGGRAFRGNDAVRQMFERAVRENDTATIEKIRIWATVMNRLADEYVVVPLPYPVTKTGRPNLKAERPYALVERDRVPELQRILKEQGDQSYVRAVGETNGNTFRVGDAPPVDTPPVTATPRPVEAAPVPPADPVAIIDRAGLTDQIPPADQTPAPRMIDTNAAMLELKPYIDEISAARAQLEAAGIDLASVSRGWDDPLGIQGRNPNYSPESTAAVQRYNQALAAFDDAKARIRQKAESIGKPDPTEPAISEDVARAILRQIVGKDGKPLDYLLDQMDPADSYSRYVGGVLADAEKFAASAGPRPGRMPTMADVQAVKNGAGDIAQRQALDNARAVLFGYDNKNYGDYVLAHAMPYSYWILRHMAQAGRYLASHPGQYAALMSIVDKWYQDTEGLSPGQRWTLYVTTLPDGTEVRFRPSAMLPFATGQILEVANPANKASNDWFVELQQMTGFGAALLPQYEVGRQALATRGVNLGPVQGLLPSGTGENRARDLLSQSRILRQVTGGQVDLEGGKLFGVEYPSFRNAVYGTNQLGIENYYTGIELAAMVKRGEITDLDAKRAMLSQKQGQPNDLYQQAQAAALQEQGLWSSIRFLGVPVGGLSADRLRLDRLGDQYGQMVEAGADSKTRGAFIRENPDLSVRFSMNDTPEELQKSIAIGERSAAIDAQPAYTGGTPEQQARWTEANRIFGDVYGKAIEAGKSTSVAAQDARSALQRAGYDYDQDFALGNYYENPERKRLLAEAGGYEFTPTRQRYTDQASVTPEDLIKRDNAQTLYFQNSDTMNARAREARVVAQFGAATWNAVKATALKSDGTKTFSGGTSGQGTPSNASNVPVQRATSAVGGNNSNVNRGTGANGLPAAKDGLQTRSVSARNSRVDWDRDPVAKGIDGQDFTVRQFWQEQDLLRQRGQYNDAARQLNQNWDALIAAGVKLTGNKPTYRNEQQEAAYQERAAILDQYGRLKDRNQAEASKFYNANREKLDRLTAAVEGRTYQPSTIFWPNDRFAPRGSRGGSIRVPRPATARTPFRPTPQPATLHTDPDASALRGYLNGKQGIPAEAYLKRLRLRYGLGVPADAPMSTWLDAVKQEILGMVAA